MRADELRAAERAITQIERQRDTAQARIDHYSGLVEQGRNPAENVESVARHTSTAVGGGAAAIRAVGAAFFLLPQVGSPFAMKWGGAEVGKSLDAWSQFTRDVASAADSVAASAGLEATFARRQQGWEHQLDQASREVAQLDIGLEIAGLRRTLAQKAVAMHDAAVQQADELTEFYASRFGNLARFTLLSSGLTRLYRDAYNSASGLARQAEQAYHLERRDPDAPTLAAGTWDQARAGLLAGEELQLGLQALERRYMDTNRRALQIDQSIALSQVDPQALLALRQTGACQFTIGELVYDLAYPGHFRRRIKSVRLTMPCIAGPYTNIAVELNLTGSRIRVRPDLAADALEDVPLSHATTMATSTAQGDSGLFELTFRDERYLPFEGAGAVSDWSLRLPPNFRQFDYSTITDVILNISYTAEADDGLRTEIQNLTGAVEGSIARWLRQNSLVRVISLRQDFSSAFTRLINSPLNTRVDIALDERAFPFWLRRTRLRLKRARVAVKTPPGTAPTGVSLRVGTATVSGLSADASLSGLYARPTTALGAGVPLTTRLAIANAGALAPAAGAAAGAVDELLMEDVLLVLEVGAA